MARKKNKDNSTENIENIESIENNIIENENESENNIEVEVEELEIVEPVENNSENLSESTEPIESPESSEISDISELIEIQIPQLSPAKKSGAFKDSVFGTTLILGIITVATALVIALLNSVTAPVIAKRLADEKQESIAILFGEGVEAEILTGYEDIYLDFAAPVTEVAVVTNKSSQKLAGYCVTVTPKGFGGQIIMLVAVNPNISVKDTKILTMSETAGIGTKIANEEWFAEQFTHKRKVEISSSTVNTISGATVSSKAFLNGVNAALDVAGEISRQMSGPVDETNETVDETGEEISDE